MWVNLLIFAIIVVDCWCIKHGVLQDRCNESEYDFYARLADEMIDNNLDQGYGTRNTSNSNASPTSTIVEPIGNLSSGVGIHLTPTKKRRKMKGEITKFLQQDWCKECNQKKYKSTYICSECGKILCHPKSGRSCFSEHVQKCHDID